MRVGTCVDCGSTYEHAPITGRVPLRCAIHEPIWRKARLKRYADVYNATVQRDKNLRKKYGITLVEWEKKFAEQGRVCAICRIDYPRGAHGWSTDHDHATGKVRGILCVGCNPGLGNFQDSPEILRAAAAYLEGVVKDARE